MLNPKSMSKSVFLLRSKHNSREKFSTPRPKSMIQDENMDPAELYLSTPKIENKSKSHRAFVTPTLVKRKRSFIEEENEMKEYQARKEYLENEIAKYDLLELQQRQDQEYHDLFATYQARKEALYNATKQLENSNIVTVFEQNNQIYNNLRSELAHMQETTRIGKEAVDTIQKELDNTQYILGLLPNNTDEIYDLGKRMISSKITFPYNKSEKIYNQLQIEYEDINRERDILTEFVNKSKIENETLEKDVAELQQMVDSLTHQRVQLLQSQNNQMEYLQPKDELDIQLLQLKKQFKQDMLEEKDRAKKEIGTLKVEHHILESKYEWVKKQANELQQQFESLNSDIDELSITQSTPKVRKHPKKRFARTPSPFLKK